MKTARGMYTVDTVCLDVPAQALMVRLLRRYITVFLKL